MVKRTALRNRLIPLFIGLVFIASNALAQQHYQADSNEYRRISLSLSSGVTFGDFDDGVRLMSSNLSVKTESTFAFGAGLQYALTPAWSVETGYRHSRIVGNNSSFETALHAFTAKNIINLNQLFFFNRISDRVNPFLSGGIGLDLYNYESADEQFRNQNTSFNLGTGLAFRASNSIDLFTQYEYHLASNSIDNARMGLGTDIVNTVTGGIRINFGQKEQTHPSWRPVPVDLSPNDYDRFVRQSAKTDSLAFAVGEINEDLRQKGQRIEQIKEEKDAEVDALTSRLEQLEERVDSLESRVEELEDRLPDGRPYGLANTLPAGHYVQIFVSLNMESARRVKADAISLLEGIIEDPDSRVSIAKRSRYFEVRIGVFDNYDDTQTTLEVVRERHEDAFVITFPRPVSFQDEYRDLNVIY